MATWVRAMRCSAALLSVAAGWLLVVAAPAGTGDARAAEQRGGWTCVPEGRACTFSSDCCSKHCVSDPKLGKVCKQKDASWTCVPKGRACTFSSDCCTKNCVSDPKLGKVCKQKGASWTCVPVGRACTFSSDCCSKRCVSDPKLGKVCKPRQPS